ncbi:MAG: PAS domain-containing protein [Gemmatimonadaceae bacterium]|nr:PAS domain-containing protein [Gemmatimonadaceae bacterium]
MLNSPPLARRVLDALPMTIWSVDLDGRITATNRSWSQFAFENGAPGLAEESAVLGRSVFESVADGESRSQIERAMTLLRTHRVRVVRWEFPCSSPDEERVFLMQVTALREGSEVSGFVFCTVDITQSHRSREALINTGIALAEAIALDQVYEEVALQLRRAVPSTGFVIALADDETAEFCISHQQGYAESSPTVPSLAHRLRRTWLEALATGHVVRAHSAVGLEITAPLLSSEGVLGAITLCAEPIESAQMLEEAERVLSVIAAQTAVAIERAWLVRRVEQKRRLEAIGEVAAGIAHELRNPLFGISSAAQLLRFRAREDPVVEKNVGRILREVERLNRMVTSLLEFGRPNAAHLISADPERVWDEILEGERARLDAKRLELRRSRSSPSVRCFLDAEQLGQVFRNILANACDAAPEGSQLTLASQLSPSGGWRCRLNNGGPSIALDVLPHVFEFFYSTKSGGTGIGLALCQRIMEEHGGTIGIESVPESGTTLTLTLPPAPAS